MLLYQNEKLQWLPQNLVHIAAEPCACLTLFIQKPLQGTSIDALSQRHFCFSNEALFLSPGPLWASLARLPQKLLQESAVPSVGRSLFTKKVVVESKKDGQCILNVLG